MKRVLNSGPACFIMTVLIIGLVTLAACTFDPPKPPGCPIPAYSAGDFALVDDVFIGEITSVTVEGCGEIYYTVKLNVTDETGNPIFEFMVAEGRLSPYEPSVP